MLAALGLARWRSAPRRGSTCGRRSLWPVEPLAWELLGKPGEPTTRLELDADAAVKLLGEAVKRAKALGLPWREEPVVLTPSDDLVKLVVKSQNLAAKQGGDAGEVGE